MKKTLLTSFVHCTVSFVFINSSIFLYIVIINFRTHSIHHEDLKYLNVYLHDSGFQLINLLLVLDS